MEPRSVLSEYHQAILATTLDGFWAVDSAGRILDVNDTYCRMTGYSRSELLTMSVADLEAHETPDEIRQHIHRAIEAGVDRFETRHRRKDGRLIDVDVSIGFVKEADYFVGFSRDLTALKQAEANVRMNERRFQTLLQGSGVVVAHADRELRYTWIHAPHPDFDADQVLGKRDDELDGNAGVDQLVRLKQRVVDTGVSEQAEISFPLSEGSLIYRVLAEPLLDEAGTIVGVATVSVDVTDYKRAESEFRAARRQLATLLDNLPGMAYRCLNDPQWTMIFISSGCVALTGYQPSDLLNNERISYADLIHPDDREFVWQSVQVALAARQSFEIEYRIIAADQTEKHVWERGVEVAGDDRTLYIEGFITDITARKQAEDALQASEAELRLVMNSTPNMIFAVDQDYRVITANTAFTEATIRAGGKPIGVGGTILSEEYPEEWIRLWHSYLDRALTGEAFDVETSLLWTDGQRHYVHNTLTPLRSTVREIIGVVIVSHDITERRLIEESERQQRVLAEALRDTAAALSSTLDFDETLDHILTNVGRVVPHDAASIMLVDGGVARVVRAHGYVERGIGQWIAGSQVAVENLLGWQLLATSGRASVLPDTPADQSAGVPANARIRSTVIAPIRIHEHMLGIIHLDSTQPNAFTSLDADRLQIFADQATVAIQNAQMYQKLASYSTDLERAVLERTVELTRANAELKRLGRVKDEFVSNVSHELKSPITTLTLHHQMLRRAPGELDKHLSVLQRETARLNHTIEDLLLLSRLDQGQVAITLSTVDLNLMAENLVHDRVLLAQLKGLQLEFDGQDDLPLVMADPGLLERVMSIFLTNAINYTPTGGHIVVRTRTVELGTGRWAGLTVSDSGLGISPDDQTHLFERFVRGEASRQAGVPGTGLGLAIAKEIIDRHHGRIEVESTGIPGSGTTFRVCLAVAADLAD